METSNQENLRQGFNQNPSLARDYPNTPFLPGQNTPQQPGAINPTLLENLQKLQNLKSKNNTVANIPPNSLNHFPNGNPANYNKQNPQPKVTNQAKNNPKKTFFSAESLKSNSVKILKIFGQKIEETAKIAIQKYQKHQQDKKDDRNPFLLQQKLDKMRKNFDEE